MSSVSPRRSSGLLLAAYTMRPEMTDSVFCSSPCRNVSMPVSLLPSRERRRSGTLEMSISPLIERTSSSFADGTVVAT